MAVNTNIYGTPEQWVNTAFYDKFHQNKKANFGNNTSKLGDGVTKGKLSYSQPIDKSLSYCCLGTESALSHIRYVQNVSNSATIIDSQDSTQTNFLFGEITTRTGLSGNYTALQLSDLKYNKAWQASFDTDTWWSSNKNKLVEPYTSIHPKSVVFLIYVIALNANFTNSINVTLSEYRSQYTNYPNISQVYIIPYMNVNLAASESSPAREPYGAAGNITGDYREGYCLALLDEYKIPSRNFSMYSYQLSYDRIVMGNLYNVETQERNTATAIIYVPENAGEHFKYQRVQIVDTYYIRTYIEYYDGILDEILKTVACFGLFFTEKTNVARYGLFTDNDMYIGVLDSQGVGHGQYLRGTATVEAPQNQWSDMSESGYDYKKPVDPNSYSDRTNFSNFTNSLLSSYAYYVAPLSLITGTFSPTLSALSEVATYPEPTNKWLFDSSFVFQEPIECILAWRRIFFKPAELPGGLHNISIGWFTTQDTGSQAYISQVENERYLLADIEIYPRYGDFRDYEPYTTMALFVPYCGMKELPLATFMGHHMQLYLIKNYRTGALEILIMVDNKYWGNMTGNASIELPLSGNKSMEYIKSRMEIEQQIEDTMMNSFSSMVGNAAGATISLAHGNPAGALIQAGAGVLNAIQGVDRVASLDYKLDHLANKIVNIQKGSTSTTPCEILYPYILIKRPRMTEGYDEDIYSKTIGHATLENRMKNSLKGYIEATSPLLDGIPCTDTERKLIVKALEEGCIFDEE